MRYNICVAYIREADIYFGVVFNMSNNMHLPTIGQILKEEFLDPLDITAYRLAKDIGVPSSRVLEILHDRRKITPDTSLRLAKYCDPLDISITLFSESSK